MTEQAKATPRKIKNPSPEELNKITNINSANSVPASKDVETPIKPVEKPIIVGSTKPDESIFSPPVYLHQLVAGKHNYKHLENVTDSGHIYIRRMTAIEESMFYDAIKNMTFDNINNVITEVLNNCIRSNVEIGQLYTVEKLALFIHVIALTYGNIQKFKFICAGDWATKNLDKEGNPQLEEYEVAIDLYELITEYFPEDLTVPFSMELTSYDMPLTLWVHYPTIDEEAFFLEESQNVITKVRSLVDKIEGTLPNGSHVVEEMYDQIMINLNTDDTDGLSKKIGTIKDYGIKLTDIPVKSMCKNKKCSEHLKTQKVDITFQQILSLIYR